MLRRFMQRLGIVLLCGLMITTTGCASTEDKLISIATDFAIASTQTDKDRLTAAYQYEFAPEGIRALTEVWTGGKQNGYTLENTQTIYNSKEGRLTLTADRRNNSGLDTFVLVEIKLSKDKKIENLTVSNYYTL